MGWIPARKTRTTNKINRQAVGMVKPFEDKVLVKPVKETEKVSDSGLVLAGLEEETPSEGIVEAVGPGLQFPNGTKLEIDLKPGDRIFYSKFAGIEYKDYLLIPYKEILAVLGDD